MSNFLGSVLHRCPDLEILILNFLLINDKILDSLTKSVVQAATGPQQLAQNLKEIGLSNTKISDKSACKLLYVLMKHTQLQVLNLE